MKRFRLKDMNITRVDLVDRGAAPDAHIVFAKADSFAPPTGKLKPKPKMAVSPAPKPAAAPKPVPSPGVLGRAPGSGSRIVRIAPTDFEVTRMDGNMMEWAIPPDKLPEGVEEALVTMVQSGDQVTFQWMIDPLAGPPVEGTANTAAEAFVAMRGGLTNTTAMDPMQMLGGFPSQMPAVPGLGGGKPGMPPAAGMGGSPKSRSVRKHYGPGPHANGTAQDVHAGGKAQGKAAASAGSDEEVFEALDIGDKYKSGPRNPVRSRGKGKGGEMWNAAWKDKSATMAANDFPFKPGTGDVSRRLRQAAGSRRLPTWEEKVMADRGFRPDQIKAAMASRMRQLDSMDFSGVTGPEAETRRRAALSDLMDEEGVKRKSGVAKRAKAERQLNETLDGVLDTIVKGLIETDIFVDTATGTDLRDILPSNLLAELTNKLSATRAPRIS